MKKWDDKPPNDKFILGPDGEPMECSDAVQWAQWFENADRSIGSTEVGRLWVSTVFLGLNHRFSNRDLPPILWETMIFDSQLMGPGRRRSKLLKAWRWLMREISGRERLIQEIDQAYQERYSSREAALHGHELAVERAQEILPDATPKELPPR